MTDVLGLILTKCGLSEFLEIPHQTVFHFITFYILIASITKFYSMIESTASQCFRLEVGKYKKNSRQRDTSLRLQYLPRKLSFCVGLAVLKLEWWYVDFTDVSFFSFDL